MDYSVITEIAEFFEYELGYEIPPRTPFVGRSFTRRARASTPTAFKDEEIYNIFDTAKILNACRRGRGPRIPGWPASRTG